MYLDTVLDGHCKGQVASTIIVKTPVRDCENFAEGSLGALLQTQDTRERASRTQNTVEQLYW